MPFGGQVTVTSGGMGVLCSPQMSTVYVISPASMPTEVV